MGHLTLQKLAQNVGITSFPDKGNDFFDEVMKDFDENGNNILGKIITDYIK